mgnify:CR=1 FL=1
MDQSRYARYGGFRRDEGLPLMTEFGYGGSGYGGFGRQGKYGGYRSSYDYSQPMRHVYNVPNGPPVNMIYPTSHTPTFLFAVGIMIILFLGLWFGKKTGYVEPSYSW